MDELAQRLGEFAEIKRANLMHTYDRPARSLGAALDTRLQGRYRALFSSISPDVVHINQQVAEDGLDLLLAARGAGIPFLSTVHIVYSAGLLGARFGRMRDFVTGNVLRRTGGTHIVVANRARQDLLARFGFLNAGQVVLVLNGVLFTQPSGTKDAAKIRWQAPAGELVIGSVGRLEAQKAPDFALRVVAGLRQRSLPVHYVWIGDGPLRREFEDQARELGIADHVIVDGWRSDISGSLQGLDIFLMPSNFEGLPLALLEAMGAGLCCCVSNVDGMAEAIESGKTGYVLPSGDVDAWVRQIEAVAANAALRHEIGDRAKNFARERFSAERMAADTLEVYQSVVATAAQDRERSGRTM
jgi:glycosyltransferase involved in cell wall biosynthesis